MTAKHTIDASLFSSPANPLDGSGLQPAKASLRVPSFRQAMKNAIVTFYGSLKAAAITLGNVDPSQLLREWERGVFLRFDEHADDEAKAFVSAHVDEALGRGTDPKLQARALIRDLRARCDELEAVIERLI